MGNWPAGLLVGSLQCLTLKAREEENEDAAGGAGLSLVSQPGPAA